jgi:hypothetical protein
MGHEGHRGAPQWRLGQPWGKARDAGEGGQRMGSGAGAARERPARVVGDPLGWQEGARWRRRPRGEGHGGNETSAAWGKVEQIFAAV